MIKYFVTGGVMILLIIFLLSTSPKSTFSPAHEGVSSSSPTEIPRAPVAVLSPELLSVSSATPLVVSSSPSLRPPPGHTPRRSQVPPLQEVVVLPPRRSPTPVPLPSIPVGIQELTKEATIAVVSTPIPTLPPTPTPTALPSLDEEALLAAVVKIQCPTTDGLGKYTGSGFALEDGVIVTAAHVIMDSASQTCDIIFSKGRRPVHYLKGSIFDFPKVRPRHDTQGIDFAFIKLKPLDAYPEAKAIFSSRYPAASYPVCRDAAMLGSQDASGALTGPGDVLFHFGYPSNFADQDYLSVTQGEAIAYADIKGIKDQLSQDGTFIYKSPVFSFNEDQSKLHAYMVSRVASFYGDSGGLAFNATKQCILGPHRGGTIGRGAGDNYSIFLLLGWEGLREIME